MITFLCLWCMFLTLLATAMLFRLNNLIDEVHVLRFIVNGNKPHEEVVS